MKKLTDLVKSFFAVALVCVMAVSCVGKEGLDTGKLNDALFGEWKITSLIAHYEINEGYEYDQDILNGDYYTLGFESDGTGAVYRDTESEEHVAGEVYTWSYAGNKLSVLFSSTSKPEVFEVTELTKNKLVMHQSEEYEVAEVKVIYSFDRVK